LLLKDHLLNIVGTIDAVRLCARSTASAPAVTAPHFACKLSIDRYVNLLFYTEGNLKVLSPEVNMTENSKAPGPVRFIRLREVLRICGMSRASLYRFIKADEFPAPVKLSARSVGWLENEVAEWAASRIRLRTSTQRSWSASRNPKP
jgi:prophage regulatory protein